MRADIDHLKPNIMFVDSHCHLDRLDKSPEQLAITLRDAMDKGVEHFLCVAVSVKDYPGMAELVAPYENVSVSCGVHPLHQDDACPKPELLAMASDEKVVAVGETGLDYYYSADTREVQRNSFVEHIQVANELQKPLIVHTRDARKDTIDLLKQHKADSVKGVLHCFTEDWEMAKAAIELGFMISISGIVTFRNAEALRDVVRRIPLEHLLIETDSPWLAPVPHRGKANEPAFVVDVAKFIADLKGVSITQLASVTTDNFYRLFDRIQRRQAA